MIIKKWNIFGRYFLLTLLSVILFSACQSTPKQEEKAEKLERYDLKGEVKSIDKANKKASIAHEEIPGYMSAMTMDFNIKEDEEGQVWSKLKVGSEIKAELVVDKANKKSWLEKITVTSAPSKQEEQTKKLGRYDIKGEVKSIDKANKKASIAHEEIPGYMSAMTMDFNIKEDEEGQVWSKLKVGSEIKAELVVDKANKKLWLEKITVASAPSKQKEQ